MGETGDGNDGGGHNIVKLKILEKSRDCFGFKTGDRNGREFIFHKIYAIAYTTFLYIRLTYTEK